ncbi:hypothetical protein Bca4012_065544 [Brassica carinata]
MRRRLTELTVLSLSLSLCLSESDFVHLVKEGEGWRRSLMVEGTREAIVTGMVVWRRRQEAEQARRQECGSLFLGLEIL